MQNGCVKTEATGWDRKILAVRPVNQRKKEVVEQLPEVCTGPADVRRGSAGAGGEGLREDRWMNTADLTERYAKEIEGVLHCSDRLVLFGAYKAIGWPGATGQHLQAHGVRLLDYTKHHADALRLEMTQRIKQVATEEGRTILQVSAGQRKETLVEGLLQRRGRRPGLVCILGAMERCRCFKVGKNPATGFLQLQWSAGKCQHFYVYFVDAEFGLGYLRIPTWAPFRLQAYANGHDWLERQLPPAGLRFRKADNGFTHLGDSAAAQALVARFDPAVLHARLDALARRLVAVHDRLGASLHWSVYQTEWATDLVFKNDRVLPDLYRQIVRTAVVELGRADIYRFLGKRPSGRGQAEVSSRLQPLVQGTRIKHTLGSTSLKMYDKAGRILRIECTTSDIRSFTHNCKVEPRRSRGRQAPAGRQPGNHPICPDAQDPLQPAGPRRGDGRVPPPLPCLPRFVSGNRFFPGFSGRFPLG